MIEVELILESVPTKKISGRMSLTNIELKNQVLQLFSDNRGGKGNEFSVFQSSWKVLIGTENNQIKIVRR